MSFLKFLRKVALILAADFLLVLLEVFLQPRIFVDAFIVDVVAVVVDWAILYVVYLRRRLVLLLLL